MYAGKDPTRVGSVAESVVLNLMGNLLDHGRILFVDNWYTSLSLAETLISRSTHLVGTLRKNRKDLPKDVIHYKLKKGMLIAAQNQLGVTILKWRDKRDVFALSTLHDDSRTPQGKPKMIDDYNQSKIFVDTSDQMCAYTPFLRKTTKWYIRLFFHLVTQTSMVNAWRLYCDVISKIKFNEFKILVIEALLDIKKSTPSSRHKLEELHKTSGRKRCTGCYDNLSHTHGRIYAMSHTKKVLTRCNKCQKYFCVNCFNRIHMRCP